MKEHRFVVVVKETLALLILLASITIFPQAFAQRAAGAPPEFKFKDVKFDYPISPRFELQGGTKAPQNSKRWMQLMLEYRVTKPDDLWLGQVTFNWSVLMLGGETPRLLMSRSVTYLEVKADGKDDLRSVVYMPPNFLERYYGQKKRVNEREVLVYVEVLIDNQRVGEYQYGRSSTRVPDLWWQSREPAVKVLEFGLLSRDMTPFGALDWDYYEFIKPRS